MHPGSGGCSSRSAGKKGGRLLNKTFMIFLCAALLAFPLHGNRKEMNKDNTEKIVEDIPEDDILSPGDIPSARKAAWEAYRKEALADGSIEEEMRSHAMAYGDVTMKYFVRTAGSEPEDGYPLYIALHGGGASDTPLLNESQWLHMQSYYRDSLECGVYVAVRGVRDTWDTHFNPESYPLYDRLIQNFILEKNINPNRVYLEGFSAGGDGVYAIAPRMADRFAAVNMSAGHPNGVNFLNMRNLPIQLQVGEADEDYGRNLATVEYHEILDKLQEEYGGYEHRTLVHYNCPHNFADNDTRPIPVMTDVYAWRDEKDRTHENVNSFPPDYMDDFTRDPLPEKVCFDPGTRAPERNVESFYYLNVPYDTAGGRIIAEYDREKNLICLSAEDVAGDFSVLLNENMVDFTKPVTFTDGEHTAVMQVIPRKSILEKTTAERGDPNYQFEAQVWYSQITASFEDE